MNKTLTFKGISEEDQATLDDFNENEDCDNE